MRISDAAELWLGELARQGKRPNTTIYTYRRFLERLADRYDPRDVDEITLSMLRTFLDAQATNKKTQRERGVTQRNSDATVAQQVTILSSFFRWLYDEEYIGENPAYRLKRPKQPRPEDNDGIVTVTAQDVQRLLAACQGWSETICLNVLIYTGARRRAVAQLRLSDYDATADPAALTFREKGGKTITKPVPRRLAELLDAAFLAGIWEDAGNDPYLIPPRDKRAQGWQMTPAYQRERSDTIVYRIVKDVARRAGVDAHVHSMRGAFAVLYIEQHPGHDLALQYLLGHARPETTRVYLRRLDRRKQMETVVDLDWGSAEMAAPAPEVGAELPPSSGSADSARDRQGLPETLMEVAHHAGETIHPPMSGLAASERVGPHPGGDDG